MGIFFFSFAVMQFHNKSLHFHAIYLGLCEYKLKRNLSHKDAADLDVGLAWMALMFPVYSEIEADIFRFNFLLIFFYFIFISLVGNMG